MRGVVHIPLGDLIFPDMLVRDNLPMGAYLRAAYVESDRRLDSVQRLFPMLAERHDQTASTLTGGERQCVAFGKGR